MKTKLLFVAVAGLLLAADDAKDAVKKDIEKLQGTWIASSLRYNGKDHDTNGKFRLQFVFKGDKVTVESSDEVKKEYAKLTFKIDPSAKPAQVDMLITSGNQKDAKVEGIYAIDKDELKICAKVFGNERPTEFASEEGSSVVLIVLKREGS
jgi:uncharacterized protein (TIGR03067 family)